MALSTLGEDGVPDVRFVLVRGVDARGFAFYTNLESVKAAQLLAHPAAAAAFGWLQLHRQVRLRGRGRARRRDAEADAYFASRPRGSRIGAWASPQSQRDRRPRPARRARARDRGALPWRRRAAARVLGRLPHRARRDRVLAGPAEPAARSPALSPRGRRPGRSSASRPERDAPGAAAARRPDAAAVYTLPMLSTSPLPALVPLLVTYTVPSLAIAIAVGLTRPLLATTSCSAVRPDLHDRARSGHRRAGRWPRSRPRTATPFGPHAMSMMFVKPVAYTSVVPSGLMRHTLAAPGGNGKPVSWPT